MFLNISMNRIIPLLITISALAACTPLVEPTTPTAEPTQISEPTRAVIPTLTPVAAIYQGVALPTPQPIDMEVAPPPAWLISDDKAVPATYGTYSISANVQGTIVGGHLDAAVPPKDGLATARLSPNEPVIIILGSGTLPLEAIQANVAKELAGTLLYGLADPRPLNRVEAHHEGNLTVLTFEPIGNEDDQILQVVVTVENNEASPFTGEATYFWRLNPAPVAALTPTPADKFAHCPASPDSAEAPRPEGLLRLAYVRAGNLWLWDEGQEPLAVTDTGDVQQVRLSADGETVLFSRQVTEHVSELWAANGDGGQLRRLAGGPEITGPIRVISFSFDGRMVAFTHHIDEHNAELWAAQTDGSSARRLVSVDELRQIFGEAWEPMGVTPTSVSWAPGTYTLNYDVFPVSDGIFLYVQNQVWTVDALSGAKGASFPPGEGGLLSYSPDGKEVAILTPDSLSLMNVEARDRREAKLDYFAVGLGEYYFFPWPAWAPDSQSLWLALPASDQFTPDGPITIWNVRADGSAATPFAEFSGFVTSIAFSPDLARVAYLRPMSPQSNTHELHIANVDGSESIVYDTADLIQFLGWSPDSQHFVYTTGWGAGTQVQLGNICAQAVPLASGFVSNNLSWLDASRFIFLRDDSNNPELYLGTLSGVTTMLLQLESRSSYDFVVVPFER